jgi:hypothetical protein
MPAPGPQNDTPNATIRVAEPHEPPPTFLARPIGAGLAIAGVAVTAVGVVLALEGAAKRDDIESTAMTTKRYDPSDGNWQTLQHAGWGMVIAGSVAAAGGATIYLLGREHAAAASRPGALSLAPGVGSLWLEGTF